MSRARQSLAHCVDVAFVPLSVTVDNHHDNDGKALRVFRAAERLMLGILQDLHCSQGEFKLQPIEKKHGTSRRPRVTLRGESPHNKDRTFSIRRLQAQLADASRHAHRQSKY